MKVVLDCNVLISAGQTDGTCRKVIDRVVRHHQFILSAPILSEYIAVAERPRLIPYISILKSLICEIEQLAVIVEPANLKFGLSDTDDEVYLATAAAGDAILITGNIRDFTEPRYGPVDVWSPREFLNKTA